VNFQQPLITQAPDEKNLALHRHLALLMLRWFIGLAVGGSLITGVLWQTGMLSPLPLLVSLMLLSGAGFSYYLILRHRLDVGLHPVLLALLVGQGLFSLNNGLTAAGLLILAFVVIAVALQSKPKAAALYLLVVLALIAFSFHPSAIDRHPILSVIESLFALALCVLIIYPVYKAIRSSLQRERLLYAELESHANTLEEQVAARTRDLTDINAELQSSEARYRSLVELSPEGVAIHDGEQIFFINQAGGAMLGGVPADFLDIPLMDLVLPEGRERARTRIQKILAGQQLAAIDGQLLRRDGLILEMEFFAGAVVYAGKTAVQFIFRDISDKKRTETELQQRRDREQATLNALPDLMFLIDHNLTYLDYRAEYAEPLSDELDDLLGRTVADLLPSPVDRQISDGIHEALASGRIVEVPYSLALPSGLHFYEARISPLADRSAVLVLARDITEQRQLEEELARSQQVVESERNLLRTLIDNLPDYVYVKDVNAAFLAANKHAQRFVGSQDESALIGKTVYDLFPREFADAYFADDMAVIQNGLPILDRIEQSIGLDGEILWIHTIKVPLRDVKGVIVGLVGLGRDITQLKTAQDAQAKTERIYRQAIAAAGGVPYQSNTITQQFTFIGDGIETLTGYPAQEMDQIRWSSLVEEHVFRGVLTGMTLAEAVHSVQSGAIPAWMEDVRIRTRSGESRWVSDTSIELRDEEGNSTGSIGFLFDITERKRIEMALRENEALFRTLFEQSPDGIFLLDPHDPEVDNRIIDCNAAACRMNGYTRDQLIGQSIALINTPGISTPEENRKVERLRSQEYLSFEISHRRADGTDFPVDVSTTLVQINGRELILGFDRDITQRKAMESELRWAKETAEAASRTKSDFLSNMSHEIRTPMNAVVGMTSLLLDTHLSGEQLEYVSTIRSSGDHLLRVINDILDFSKIESGKLELESVPFYLRECVETSIDLFAGEAAQKGVELVAVFAADVPPSVISDPTRLRQILTNLVSNAIKFTHTGEVVITTTSEPAGDEHVRLRFSVRDTGTGIPAQSLERLFKSFSQVDASTTRKYGGSGLGLAISRHICEAMGGELQVESTPGIGSTFYFELTMAVSEDLIEPSVLLSPFLAGKRLLVVDDNKTAREWAISMAERKGLIAIGANSGAIAAQMLSGDSPFDVVLVDIELGDMRGLELIDKLRQGMGDSLIPVILHAPPGTIDSGTLQRTKAIHTVLSKPLKESDLDRVLASLFHRKAEDVYVRTRPSEFNHNMAEQNPLRILLAEDNLINQMVAERMLAKLGYRIDVVVNGIEVLAALRRQPYDMVLMDIQMPEMDGIEATRSILSEWQGKERPLIVAMTAYAHAEARNIFEEAGMDGYITKPVRLEDLAQMLNRLGQKRAAMPDAGADHQPASAGVI